MAVAVEPVAIGSFEEVGAAWRALETRAAGHSFFQSWTWVGCLAEERYDDPVLLRATAGGEVVGLALFNRREGTLFLAESGKADLDAPFIEHNAPLLTAGAGPEVLAALMRAAWRVAGCRRLMLGGVPPAVLRAADGWRARLREDLAPWVDLAALRAGGQDWFATLSANTRYQLRRSARHFEAIGPLRLSRAEGLAQALAWLDALAALHAESWRLRGQPGAFAADFPRRFHRRLVERAEPRGELDLLKLEAGGETLGYLYNFRHGGRIYAYQSGLSPAHAGRHGKPGLTCHAMAIARALAEGFAAYDFLAGAARYKLSLANASAPLLWAELVPRWSARGLVAQLRSLSQRAAGRG